MHTTPLTPANTFHGQPVKIVMHNGKRWLTAEQVGRCLGYADGNVSQGIINLYNRNKDEFCDTDTLKINLIFNSPQRGNPDTRIFSATGCNLLGFFANTQRAKEFRKWAKDVLAQEAAPPARFSARGAKLTLTREVEVQVLIMFVEGLPICEIARRLKLKKGNVSPVVHGNYRFSPQAGDDLTTPELRQAVADKHMHNERMRFIHKYRASLSNQPLATCIEHASRSQDLLA